MFCRYIPFCIFLTALVYGGSVLALSADRHPEKTGPLPDAPDYPMDGYYEIVGKQHGKPYAGMMTIRKEGNTYAVSYLLEGGAATIGMAFRNGDRLCVAWVATGTGKATGATLYTINGKVLVGRWISIPTDGKVHEETLTWIRKLAKVPLET